MPSDQELVALAVAGDRDAFASLYDRYAAPVHDFLARMLGSPHEASDALQDTFITAGERLHQLRDPARFRPWVYAIARRRAYLTTERASRFSSLEDTEMLTTDPDPTDSLAAEEYRALISGAAGGLGHRDRTLLDLHLRHGLDGDDLADTMGVDRSHVHVMMHRMRAKLEAAVGSVVLIEHGRSGCPELSRLVGAWSGDLTPTLRKRVTRHADACEACGSERERRLRPEVLLGLVPFAPEPALAREAVLGRVELCSHRGDPWPGPDGFPPASPPPAPAQAASPRRRSRRRVALTLVAIVLGAVAAVTFASHLTESSPPPPADADEGTDEGESSVPPPGDPASPAPVGLGGSEGAPAASASLPSSSGPPPPSSATTAVPGGTTVNSGPTTIQPAPTSTTTEAPVTSTSAPTPPTVTTTTTRPDPPGTTSTTRPDPRDTTSTTRGTRG